MSEEKEIKKLIEKALWERFHSAKTTLTNMANEFSDRKDGLVQQIEKIKEQDDPKTYAAIQLQINSLQTEMDNLYVALLVLKYLEK